MERVMIDNLFLPHESSIIKAIPLHPQDPHDWIIWDGSKSGEYPVKNGYSILKAEAAGQSWSGRTFKS